MKRIDKPEFSKIKNMLVHGNKEDVKIAILILKDIFTINDFLHSFPGKVRDGNPAFQRNSEFTDASCNISTWYKHIVIGFHNNHVWTDETGNTWGSKEIF